MLRPAYRQPCTGRGRGSREQGAGRKKEGGQVHVFGGRRTAKCGGQPRRFSKFSVPSPPGHFRGGAGGEAAAGFLLRGRFLRALGVLCGGTWLRLFSSVFEELSARPPSCQPAVIFRSGSRNRLDRLRRINHAVRWTNVHICPPSRPDSLDGFLLHRALTICSSLSRSNCPCRAAVRVRPRFAARLLSGPACKSPHWPQIGDLPTQKRVATQCPLF